MNNRNSSTTSLGISGLCLLWGIVTQCLSWAGVVTWPWYAIWGPILFVFAIWALAVVLSFIIALISYLVVR